MWHMWINMEFGNAVYTHYLTLLMGPICFLSTGLLFPSSRTTEPSEKSQCSSLCLTKFYTCWDGSKPLVHCYWENHGRLRIGIDHHCKIPNWENTVIVLVVVSKIFYLQMGWNEWVETTNIPRTTIVIHGIFKRIIYIYTYVHMYIHIYRTLAISMISSHFAESAAQSARRSRCSCSSGCPSAWDNRGGDLCVSWNCLGSYYCRMSWKISEDFQGY